MKFCLNFPTSPFLLKVFVFFLSFVPIRVNSWLDYTVGKSGGMADTKDLKSFDR